jgi:aryl-alcohol dehydrogenase-like predicted oxidoreductase
METRQLGNSDLHITPIGLGAWTLRQPAVTAAIVGARRPDQIDGIIGAAAFRLSDAEIAEIEAVSATKA